MAACIGAALDGRVSIGAACVCRDDVCTGAVLDRCVYGGSTCVCKDGVCVGVVLDGGACRGGAGMGRGGCAGWVSLYVQVPAGLRCGSWGRWAGSVCGAQAPTTLLKSRAPRCCPHQPARTPPGCARAACAKEPRPVPRSEP